ncbi:DUF5701 family protein, partial [Streptomyces cyaneofuscatus]
MAQAVGVQIPNKDPRSSESLATHSVNTCHSGRISPHRPLADTAIRAPAIWISNGTGRDGGERRNAPKVGWCWA